MTKVFLMVQMLICEDFALRFYFYFLDQVIPLKFNFKRDLAYSS
jgi:hypothetical protein